MEHFDGGWVGGLLALHGGNDDLVAGGELFEVGFLIGVGFGELEDLGEEVVGDCFLKGLGVGLFDHNPAGDLVDVGGRIFGEFDNLGGGLFDCFEIGVHFRDDIVVIENAARNLAMGRDGCGSEEGECAKCEDGSVHNE